MKSAIKKHLRISVHPYESVPVILVSGIGRSGTTALRHAFSAHPEVDSTGCENNIIYDVVEAARHNCSYWSRKGTMRVVQPAYDRQFKLLLLNLLWPGPRRGTARPNILVATSDMSADRADFFCQVFPGCRIPYIVRNGIEVLSSRMEHENFKDVAFEEHCHTWVRSYDMARWGVNREEFVVVRHEALVDNPDKTVAEALSSCGLSSHADCVNAVAETRFHPTAAAGESAEAGGDLKQRHQRWEGWSDSQRATFEEICGEAMDYFGYPMPWSTL
jgi:hypothetical protein